MSNSFSRMISAMTAETTLIYQPSPSHLGHVTLLLGLRLFVKVIVRHLPLRPEINSQYCFRPWKPITFDYTTNASG